MEIPERARCITTRSVCADCGYDLFGRAGNRCPECGGTRSLDAEQARPLTWEYIGKYALSGLGVGALLTISALWFTGQSPATFVPIICVASICAAINIGLLFGPLLFAMYAVCLVWGRSRGRQWTVLIGLTAVHYIGIIFVLLTRATAYTLHGEPHLVLANCRTNPAEVLLFVLLFVGAHVLAVVIGSTRLR
jgi:hypothetical protein